jgi:DNA-binding CsgD family transcriptional regulator
MADHTAPPMPIPASPLVGRERECAFLRDALVAALAGRGSLVLVGGEAGIGKTALAEATLVDAGEQGALVLVGRCYDLSEPPPYGPWGEALTGAPDDPALPVPPDLSGRAATSRAALFAAVRDYLARLVAARPLVLLLDDLHWADPASLDLLRFLGRTLAPLPVLVIATYRADELARGHPLYALLPLLVREARAARLDLQPLGESDVRTLARARYTLTADDEGRLVAHLRDRAEGNPFFTGELLRALEEEGCLRRAPGGAWTLGDLGDAGVPPLLRQVIDARVDRLGEAARAHLAVAAVLGQDVPTDLWAAVAGADDEALLATIVSAAGAGLLVETVGGVRFAHALTREAVYAGTPGLRRRAWHRRAAAVLLAAARPDPDAVATHLQRAGDPRAAVVTAVARFRAALALLDGPEHAALAGNLALQIGYLLRRTDPARSIHYSEEAIRRAQEAGASALAGAARCHLGYVLFLRQEFVGALAELRAGVAELAALPPAAWARVPTPPGGVSIASLAEARGLLAWVLTHVGAHAEALGQLGGTLDAAVAHLDTLGYYAQLAVYQAATACGHPAVARRVHEQLRDHVRAPEDAVALGATLLGLLVKAALPYYADDRGYIAATTTLAERAWAQAQAVHLAPPFPLRALRFPLDFICGAWDTEPAAVGGTRVSYSRMLFGTIARLRGAPGEAWGVLRAAFPIGLATEPGTENLLDSLGFLLLGAHLFLDADDLAGARQWAEAHDRWLAWSGAALGRAEGQALWSQYQRRAGDPARARAHAAAALRHASDPRQPLALLAAHRLAGELATEAGQHGEARDHLDAALALADACGARYERALTVLALAELCASTRDEAGARAALAEARATLAALGAQPALARADALAARLADGASPAALPFGLTAREAEVLRLVAAGLTNAQAADRLFITARTVNAHLTAIYTKLGVGGRPAAIRLAVERGLA